MSDVCGRTIHGYCDMPKAHNMGRADVPENHRIVDVPDVSPERIAATEAIHAMGCLGWRGEGGDRYHVCRSMAGNVCAALFHKGMLNVAADPSRSDLGRTDDTAQSGSAHADDCLSRRPPYDERDCSCPQRDWPDAADV